MSTRRSSTLIAAAASVLLLVSADAIAVEQVHRNFNLPAQFSATIQTSNCSAVPGPRVSLQGGLTLSGLKADVIFTKLPGASSPQESIAVEQVVVPDDELVSIPAQSVTASAASNPFIWLQLTDHDGKALTSEIFLGRCDQAQFTPSVALAIPSEAVAGIATSECESSTGPSFIVDGAATLSGVTGKLIFRSSNEPGAPQGQVEKSTIDVVMVPSGQSYAFPQQAVVAGAGGNPLISMQLRDGNDEPIGSEIRLGRCVSLTR